MHIPDGFLSPETLISTGVISLGFLTIAVKRVNKHLSPKRVSVMGLSAAFVFTAQLLSFPTPVGIPAHIIGAVLISILLGPFSGLVIITAALFLQVILFQHGGLLSLGANVLNMGIVGCLLGYLFYKIMRSSFIAGAFAAWFTTIVCASFCAIELGLSGKVSIKVALISMSSVYIFVGIVEGVVTFFALNVINKIRPDLLNLQKV